jgi:Ca2+-binding EF-hand superfamily protein
LYLLSKNAESVPHSRGEAVLARIQDAAVETANAGRPFLALCSLTDQKLTGFMSPAELLHTFKMMGITVTPEELRSVQELLPSSAVSKEGSVDYRELFWIVQTQSTQGTQFYPDTDGTHRFNFPPKAMSFSPNRNASNPFSTFTPIPSSTTRYLPDLETVGFDKSLMSTPIGTFMSTPLKADQSRRDHHSDPPQRNRHVSDIIAKVRGAIAEKNRLWGTKFHLQKQFEVYDGDQSGYVSLAIFQTILDDLSVPLSASDIYMIRSRYGRTEYDAIDYLEFCQEVTNSWEVSKPSTSLQTSLAASRTFSTSRAFLPPPSRLSETLRSLRNSGRDPRDIFQAYDLDNTGMVSRTFLRNTAHLTLDRWTCEDSKKLFRS